MDWKTTVGQLASVQRHGIWAEAAANEAKNAGQNDAQNDIILLAVPQRMCGCFLGRASGLLLLLEVFS